MQGQSPYRTLMNERRVTGDMLEIFGGFRLGIQGGEHRDPAAVVVASPSLRRIETLHPM